MYNHYVTSAFLDKKKLTRWVLPTCFFALSVSTPSLAAENACGPAVLDADFNVTIPCLTTADGQRYSVNWLYKPEINPFSGDPVMKWEWKLGDEVVASCAASDNCAFKYDDLGLIIIPEVTNGAQSFYSATLMLDNIEADKLNLWYLSHSPEDGRLPASAMPEMDKGLAPSIQGTCGSIPQVTPTDLDTDSDGLTDTYEDCIGTNKYQADTDGDGFKDRDELTQGTAILMNPLVADVPLLVFDVQGNTTLSLKTENSQTHEKVTGQATTISNTTGTQRTDSASLEVSLSTTVGTEVSTTGASASVSVTAGFAATTEFSRTVSQENTSALEKTFQTSTTEGKTVTGGTLSVGVTIRNTSNIGVTVSNMNLNALFEDGSIIGTLIPTSSTLSLFPNTSGSAIFTTDLDTDTALALVRNPLAAHYYVGTLPTMTVNTTSTGDTPGARDFAGIATNINARTAAFKIDFNDGGTTIYNLRPAIPTTGLTLDQVLDRLGILYQKDTAGKLTGLCNENRYAATTCSTWIANNTTSHAYWVIQSNGQFLEGTALSSIKVYAGDPLFLLVYITDADGDKLDKRVEALYGSLDSKPDTDSDGLDDYQEIYGWSPIATTAGFPYDQANPPRIYSDPTKADGDSDGLTDVQEKAKGTDPMRLDTDSDGLPDSTDANPVNGDSDSDGLLDGEENQYKTDSTKADTDGDGLSDGREVKCVPTYLGCPTDPLKADTDSDGLSDSLEVNKGTDPTKVDTDGDGINDKGDPEPLQVKYIADVQLRASDTSYISACAVRERERDSELTGYTFIGCWNTAGTAYGTNSSSGKDLMSMYVQYKSANFDTSVRTLTGLTLISQDCTIPLPDGTIGCWKVPNRVKPTESLVWVEGKDKPAILQATYATVSLSTDSRVRDIFFKFFEYPDITDIYKGCVQAKGYKVGCWNSDKDQAGVPVTLLILPSISGVYVQKYMFMQIQIQ